MHVRVLPQVDGREVEAEYVGGAPLRRYDLATQTQTGQPFYLGMTSYCPFEFAGEADAMGWDGTFLADLKIAVSEACSNVVMHAYEGADGPLELTGWVDGDAVTFVVTDRGSGISPRLQTPAAGLGLGLPLMAALSDGMEVVTRSCGGTELRMRFSLRTSTHPDDQSTGADDSARSPASSHFSTTL